LSKIQQATTSTSKTSGGTKTVTNSQGKQIVPLGELGGTDSGKIRSFVWQGAIDAWLHNPIFGTGVETFAFAYYKYRPPGHNMTSEWDYLYNKAHNEYLNYLATTGAFGLLTYLAFIGLFLYLFSKDFYAFYKKPQEKKENIDKPVTDKLLSLSLITSLFTILISNFFGFSVVIVNVYLFVIPLFVLAINNYVDPQKVIFFPGAESKNTEVGYGQKMGISVMCIVGIYFIAVLINFWFADREYGFANNLDKVGQYQLAFDPIHKAVENRPDEPVFKDELSINDAYMAIAYAQQKDATNASRLVQEAIAASDDITTNHPNNVVFWKSRVRLMYTLAQANAQFIQPALEAIDKAHDLAPTDAKIDYNRGLLYAQDKQIDKGISILQET
ncbi:MAG: O-antigen ligase family protein, partial [Patescibacteria group bacterium]|nr:O-antigen ligase family protein [Patescibacteria group bacterium]